MQLTLSLSHQWSPRQTQTLEFGTHVQFIHTHSHSHSHRHTFRSRHLVCVCLCLNKFPYTTSTQAHLQFVWFSSCTHLHTHAIPHNHTSNGVCPMFVYVCVCAIVCREGNTADERTSERTNGTTGKSFSTVRPTEGKRKKNYTTKFEIKPVLTISQHTTF